MHISMHLKEIVKTIGKQKAFREVVQAEGYLDWPQYY